MATKTKPKVPRSFAVDEAVWVKAKARAEKEGMSISRLLNLLVQGYAEGQVPTPRTVTTYSVDDKR